MKFNPYKILLSIGLIVVTITVIWAVMYFRIGFVSNPANRSTIGDITPPIGYTRVSCDETSFAAYLRTIPLKKRGSRVYLYGGERLARFQGFNYAVVDVPLLSNAEQCADVCMRLRAEYLFKTQQYSKISFTALDGTVKRYSGGSSRKAFEKYMREVFGTCNTTSMYQSMPNRNFSDLQIGDVFVYKKRKNGSYGHAVIVVDIAVNKDGKKAFLVVEGNTPARDMHLMRNTPNPFASPWFFLDETSNTQYISPFVFKHNELKHW